MKSVVFVLFAIGLAGCSSLEKPARPRAVTIEETTIVSYPADHAGVALWNRDGQQDWSCAQPLPDVASGASEGVQVSDAAVQAGGGFAESVSAISLGGRSPAVLIAREMLYRACELAANLGHEPATTLHIYERMLQSIERISQANLGSGAAGIASQEAPVSLSGFMPSASEPKKKKSSASSSGHSFETIYDDNAVSESGDSSPDEDEWSSEKDD